MAQAAKFGRNGQSNVGVRTMWEGDGPYAKVITMQFCACPIVEVANELSGCRARCPFTICDRVLAKAQPKAEVALRTEWLPSVCL